MKLAPLFALSLLFGQGFAQSSNLKSPTLRKAKVIGDVEKQGQDLTLSKAIEAAKSVHTSVLSKNHQVDRRLQAENWVQLGGDIDGEAVLDQSGFSVDLSGDGKILAVGAHLNNGNGLNSGHVRVFKWDDRAWKQLGSNIDGEARDDWSGRSVALSQNGQIVAVGANLNDGNGRDSGHVRVFKWDGVVWTQLGNDVDGEARDDQSGYSVDLSGNGKILAVGAHLNNGNGIGFNSGHVRVFKWDGRAWKQVGSDIDGEARNDSSGQSVALSKNGNIVAVGALLNDGNGINSGHARVFRWTGRVWKKLGSDIDGEAADNWSGFSVDLSCDGKIVAIGAIRNDDGGSLSGHARVFEWDNARKAWKQLGSDIDGEAISDRSGYSVSLSNTGKVVAVGAVRNDGTRSPDAGHTRVFKLDGNAWVQVGDDIDGEAAGDRSGHSVALSSSGSAVAVGAPYNDGRGTSSGHARVYNLIAPLNFTIGCNGDPHFKTWKGEHFEYHGQCDMILTKDDSFANGLGLEFQIRTKLIRFWSYIRGAAIRIGDDILEIEGSADPVLTEANNHYWINVEYQGELTTLGGFPVKYHLNGLSNTKRWMSSKYPHQKIERWFEIDLSSKYPGQKIVISTFREFVRVDFENGSDESFGNAVGMLGDFRTGKTLARDGDTELDDFVMLGNEWQVLPHENMLFHDISKPQFPEKCIDPKHPKGERRRLGESSITEEQAEAACAFIEDPLDRMDCVYDVLATQDIDMVGAY